jgi:hypothetical protein
MVKHRQLARQVGAFGGFASKSSADLDNMIFSMGSTAFEMESYPGSFRDGPSSFPLGLHNMASVHQEFNSTYF